MKWNKLQLYNKGSFDSIRINGNSNALNKLFKQSVKFCRVLLWNWIIFKWEIKFDKVKGEANHFDKALVIADQII